MRFSIFVILAALFISCKSNTGADEFQPYQIGYWLMTSETRAEYTGSNYKAKTMQSDTTILADSQHREITITKGHEDRFGKWFNVSYVDSTVSKRDSIDTEIIFDFNDYLDESISEGRRSFVIGMEHFHFEFDATYKCDVQARPDTKFNLTMNRLDGSHFQTYVIRADGFTEVLDEILCH